MIKFRGENRNGVPVIGLGLSRANCERLLAGQPIRLSLDEIVPTLNAEVVIIAGETERAMFDDLKSHGMIAPDTKVHGMHPDDPHGK